MYQDKERPPFGGLFSRSRSSNSSFAAKVAVLDNHTPSTALLAVLLVSRTRKPPRHGYTLALIEVPKQQLGELAERNAVNKIRAVISIRAAALLLHRKGKRCRKVFTGTTRNRGSGKPPNEIYTIHYYPPLEQGNCSVGGGVHAATKER